MRILNSLIVPKNVKGGPLGFFNINPVAKSQKKLKGEPFGDIKIFEKKGAAKVSKCRKIGKGGPLWVLFFKLEAFRCVQNQVLSTFGKGP